MLIEKYRKDTSTTLFEACFGKYLGTEVVDRHKKFTKLASTDLPVEGVACSVKRATVRPLWGLRRVAIRPNLALSPNTCLNVWWEV